MWNKLNPAIPRYWLFGIAGLVWTAAGLLLCARAIIWLHPFPLSTEISLELMGVAIAGLAYFYVFATIVQKNLNRIGRLPDHACAFAFTAWKGYLMIGFMVTVGITLRNSPVPKHLLSVPYTAMGVVLMIGSVRFYQRFVALAVRKKK